MPSSAPDGALLYRALLRPDTVAVVGASDTAGKAAARPMEYLRRHGWAGKAFAVNPARETVLGERAWPSLGELPAVPDHVFVLTGADAALGCLRECAGLGVRVATVLADGFLESDPGGPGRRAELREILGRSGLRVLGPGSLGVATIAGGFALTANAAFGEAGLPVGDVFVASQSGSAIGALMSRGKELGIGFSSMVSTGGELDLTLGEICLASVDDVGVASYALFLENLRGAGDLQAFAAAAAERGKPVLAYKLGRSDAGARLAVSHTGALAGDDAVADAVLRDLGIARVRTFEALLEGQHLARKARIPARGAAGGAARGAAGGAGRPRPRVCVLSTTGGGGAMAVDCLAMAGAELPGPSADTVARLAEVGVTAGHGALIDLTLAGTRSEVMSAALDVVLTAPEFDAVVAVPGSSARLQPELTVRPIAARAGAGKPLAAFVMPSAPEALRLLQRSGVSAFRTPESCADAVVAILRRRLPVGAGSAAIGGPGVIGGAGEVLDEARSYEVLSRLGVAHAAYVIVPADGLPVELPVPGPVAVKVLSAELPHKSDVGGVVLGVTDGAGLRSAAAGIARDVARLAPGVAVDRLLVQTMARGVGEALVGYRCDADAGPVVVLAAGGLLAELYADRSVRPAPVDLDTAWEMIGEVVGFRALAGYRGKPAGDLGALAEAVVAMSRLAEAEGAGVSEAEVNPLLVLEQGRGVLAVDALVRCGRTAGR